MKSNKKRNIKIFNRWLKENQLYFKYMNETKQNSIYLKKIPYNVEKYIMQRLNEENEDIYSIISLTIDFDNSVYGSYIWICAASRWVRYCLLHHIE